MKNFKTYIKQTAKKAIGAALALVLLASPLAMASFFPERPVKDWNNVADRSGFDHVVFNSFINTPFYGDERHFLDSRVGSGNDAADNYKDVLEGVKDGDTVTLRAYVHNNGNQSLNGENFDGPTVASNARVRFLLPTGTAKHLRATSFITADNAVPGSVSDTGDLKSNQPFSVEYIPGSATLVTGVNGGKNFKLSDDIVKSGAQIGYDQVNGKVPGCFEYQAFVYIKVKVKAPKLDFEKKVQIGNGSFQEQVEAKPGDTVKWLLSYKNSGTQQINNTVIRDKLPNHLTLVPGSVKLVDAKHPNGMTITDGDMFDANGVNAGSYTAGSNGYITFETKVASADKLPECVVTLRNIAGSRADDIPEDEDDASVVVRKDCKPTEEEKCPVPGKQHLPKNHPDCKDVPPVTPPSGKLPSTGPGEMIGLFVATTIAGSLAHKLVLSRRYF